MWRADSLEKTLMLGKIEGRRRRGRQRMRWLDGITDSMDMGWVDSGSWWWTGRPGVLRFMGSQRDTNERLNWRTSNGNTKGKLIYQAHTSRRLYMRRQITALTFIKYLGSNSFFQSSQNPLGTSTASILNCKTETRRGWFVQNSITFQMSQM